MPKYILDDLISEDNLLNESKIQDRLKAYLQHTILIVLYPFLHILICNYLYGTTNINAMREISFLSFLFVMCIIPLGKIGWMVYCFQSLAKKIDLEKIIDTEIKSPINYLMPFIGLSFFFIFILSATQSTRDLENVPDFLLAMVLMCTEYMPEDYVWFVLPVAFYSLILLVLIEISLFKIRRESKKS